jgi:hypothetical protein
MEDGVYDYPDFDDDLNDDFDLFDDFFLLEEAACKHPTVRATFNGEAIDEQFDDDFDDDVLACEAFSEVRENERQDELEAIAINVENRYREHTVKFRSSYMRSCRHDGAFVSRRNRGRKPRPKFQSYS